MNYIESTKSDGEDILKFFNISKWAYVQIYFQMIIGAGIMFASAMVLDFDLNKLS